jgi:hypothetical protein
MGLSDLESEENAGWKNEVLGTSAVDGARRELNPFACQVTRESTIREIQKWLQEDLLLDLWTSFADFHTLKEGRTGTGDRRLIDEYVAPEGLRDSLVITIDGRMVPDPGIGCISRTGPPNIENSV